MSTSKLNIITLISCIVIFVVGCAPSVKKLGMNTYKITASSPWGVSGAMDAFHTKASEICGGRYDVGQTETRANPGYTDIFGVITCK